MDLEVKWSPEAIEDLESIAEFIARDSEYYARAVVTEIISVSGNVREFPLIGRVVTEIGDEGIRERFIYSYRVAPHIRNPQVHIPAKDCRRDNQQEAGLSTYKCAPVGRFAPLGSNVRLHRRILLFS